MLEFFCKNSKRLSSVNYFRKKGSIIDTKYGPKYATDLRRRVIDILTLGSGFTEVVNQQIPLIEKYLI